MSNDLAFQQAYNLRVHQKKLTEIKKSPTKRLDNHLPRIFLSVRKRQGYKDLWWSHRVTRDNEQLLNRLIEIKRQKRSISQLEKNSEKKLEHSQIGINKSQLPSSHKGLFHKKKIILKKIALKSNE